MRVRRTGAALLAALFLSSASALAQAGIPTSTTPELRADFITGRQSAVQVGGGLQIPLGYYVRLGAVAAAGVRTGETTGSRAGGRVDLLARFLLDPFRQTKVGFSAGAGLSARVEPGERVTPLLLVALDLEGRRRPSGWTPALQLGLGGGARIGLVLRKGAAGAR